MYCHYFHVRMVREEICLVVGLLRAEVNLAFDRALEGHKDVFEFFVTPDQEEEFLRFTSFLARHGLILSVEKKINRLMA